MSTTEYKVQAVWSIEKETIMNLKNLKEISSERFDTTLPNIQYSIKISNDICDDGEILIQFQCHEKDAKNESDWCENISNEKIDLFINSANYQDDLLKEHFGRGFRKFGIKFDLEQLLNLDNKYFVNDILTLEIRGILKYEKTEFNLGNVLWKKDDKDFKFIVGNKTIMAHKFIIRQFSSVFAAAMDSDEFKIDNFKSHTVEDAIKLCYGIQPSYNGFRATVFELRLVDFLYKLIEFANVYDMPLIKEQVENELEELIDAENVCEVANKSLELKAEILRSYCVNFLSDCIKTGKPFTGTLDDLKPEIVALVFKASFCHTQTFL